MSEQPSEQASGVDVGARVVAWDDALSAIRGRLRAWGVREVLTPLLAAEVALEPFVEPVAVGSSVLITSPELYLKGLVAAGAGDVYAVAQCHREGEVGRVHARSFHLVEWYRAHQAPARARADVEALVGAVYATQSRAPPTWQVYGFLERVETLVGLRLRGDETAAELLVACGDHVELCPSALPGLGEDAAMLFAWTSFMTNVCDRVLDPFLAARAGVHIVDFPAPLAALARQGNPSQTEGPDRGADHRFALRFESYVGGVELANGYVELADATEQHARFESVARIRVAQGLGALPMPEQFLATLRTPGLPPCSGVALGLERLLMLATGRRSLAQIAVF